MTLNMLTNREGRFWRPFLFAQPVYNSIGTPGSSLVVRIVSEVFTLVTFGADVSCDVSNS